MNEQRRKNLRAAIGHLEAASNLVEQCATEEQMAYDALPEAIQWTERGEKMQEAVDAMEEAVNLIDDATKLVDEASA